MIRDIEPNTSSIPMPEQSVADKVVATAYGDLAMTPRVAIEPINFYALGRAGLLLQLAATTETMACLAAERDALYQLAITDDLTGLLNSRGLRDRLNKSEEAPVALLNLDLTHFKSVNDTFGHDRGDTVLKDMAEALRHTVRQEDIIARPSRGGDEFVIILYPHARSGEASAREERLAATGQRVEEVVQEYLERHPDLKTCGLDISVGGAIVEPGTTINDETFSRADEAMYAHKEQQHQKSGKSRR